MSLMSVEMLLGGKNLIKQLIKTLCIKNIGKDDYLLSCPFLLKCVVLISWSSIFLSKSKVQRKIQ